MFLLFGADVVAQIEIDVTLEVVHMIAEGGKFLLQGDAGVTRQRMVVGRPIRSEEPAAVQPVCEMADCDRIDIGVVILLQHIEIRRDKKCRSFSAARKQQNGAARGGQRLSVGTYDAALAPFLEAAAA